MKKVLALLVIMAFAVSFSGPAYANYMLDKLGDGTKQILMSPKQIADHSVSEMENSEFKPFGFLGGLVKGVIHTGVEIFHGAVKVVTFPFPEE